MAKQQFDRSKPHVNVAPSVTLTTARLPSPPPHPGNGREGMATSGTSAASTMRRKSGERGVTIAIAHVEYESDTRHYAHVDCPGHADYIKNMITGAAQMDGAVLVVSAPDGPMPQTREHILLARQVEVPRILVALNKVDRMGRRGTAGAGGVGSPRVALTYDFPGDDTPIVRVSALNALEGEPDAMQGVADLVSAHGSTTSRCPSA